MRANAEPKGGETAKPLLLISRTLAQLQIIPLTRLLRSTINVSSAWNYICIGLQRDTTSEARYVTAAHMISLVNSDFRLSKYTKCSVKMSVNRSMQLHQLHLIIDFSIKLTNVVKNDVSKTYVITGN